MTEEKKEEEVVAEISSDQAITFAREGFEELKATISKYVDLKPAYNTVAALWILGTYMHSAFETFPYLFLNAMKGSGKTRALKLITNTCREGQLLASITESVLFRSKGTLAIDEFESVGSKEKQALRELLNAGYKKGIVIKRMQKRKTILGEQQVVEEFEAYRPIVMANIWGMDEVLLDRCIPIQLEKSSSLAHIKLIEDFDRNPTIKHIKQRFSILSVVLCSVVTQKEYIYGWNEYIIQKYTLNDTIHLTQPNTTELHKKVINDEFYRKIDESGLDGRHLELYFPLFVIAKILGDDVLEEVFKIAGSNIEEKRLDEVMESKDIMLFDFIFRHYEPNSWIAINDLTRQFREFIGDEEKDFESWLNPKWMGRAIKRLCLVLKRRRLGRGMDVIIDKEKAESKIKMFQK